MYRKGREFFRYYVIKDIFCTDFTFIMTNNRQQNPVFHIVKVIIFSLPRNENVRAVTDCVFDQESAAPPHKATSRIGLPVRAECFTHPTWNSSLIRCRKPNSLSSSGNSPTTPEPTWFQALSKG